MTVLRAILERQTLSSRRKVARRKLRLEAQASGVSANSEVVILDLSTTGLLLETSDALAIGETIDFDLQEASPARAVVKWSSGPFFGCQFKEPISSGAVSAALLRAPPVKLTNLAAFEPEFVDGEEEEVRPSGELSFQAKMRWVAAFSLLSWAAIGAAIWLIWPFFN